MKAGVFFTSTGETVTGDRLQDGLNKVADDYKQLAIDIRKEDAYASHVTDAEKEKYMNDMIAESDEIRKGAIKNMTTAQKLNFALCGECPAILP